MAKPPINLSILPELHEALLQRIRKEQQRDADYPPTEREITEAASNMVRSVIENPLSLLHNRLYKGITPETGGQAIRVELTLPEAAHFRDLIAVTAFRLRKSALHSEEVIANAINIWCRANLDGVVGVKEFKPGKRLKGALEDYSERRIRSLPRASGPAETPPKSRIVTNTRDYHALAAEADETGIRDNESEKKGHTSKIKPRDKRPKYEGIVRGGMGKITIEPTKEKER